MNPELEEQINLICDKALCDLKSKLTKACEKHVKKIVNDTTKQVKENLSSSHQLTKRGTSQPTNKSKSTTHKDSSRQHSSKKQNSTKKNIKKGSDKKRYDSNRSDSETNSD